METLAGSERVGDDRRAKAEQFEEREAELRSRFAVATDRHASEHLRRIKWGWK